MSFLSLQALGHFLDWTMSDKKVLPYVLRQGFDWIMELDLYLNNMNK